MGRSPGSIGTTAEATRHADLEAHLDQVHSSTRAPGWWAQAHGSFNRELREFVDRELLPPEPT